MKLQQMTSRNAESLLIMIDGYCRSMGTVDHDHLMIHISTSSANHFFLFFMLPAHPAAARPVPKKNESTRRIDGSLEKVRPYPASSTNLLPGLATAGTSLG
jgi:hypothetical protein